MPKKYQILAVDDEPINLFLLEELLSIQFEVLTADSGEKALVLANECPPDLILLDINMPGLNGYEVCEQLKANFSTQSIPVIFLTALSQESDELKGLALGAVDFILKPFSGPILISRVSSHIQLYQVTQQLARERQRVGDLVNRMMEDERFYCQNMSYFSKSLEETNGDSVLSKKIDEHRQIVLMADTTGHGLAAATCNAMVSTLFYRHETLLKGCLDLCKMLNEEMYHRLPSYMFVTATIIELNLETQQVLLWNFSQPAALFYRQGQKINEFASRSVPIGVLNHLPPDMLKPYKQSIKTGDCLFAFTDGLTELKCQDNQVDEHKMCTLIETQLLKPGYLSERIGNILTACEAQQADIKDDITLVEIKVP